MTHEPIATGNTLEAQATLHAFSSTAMAARGSTRSLCRWPGRTPGRCVRAAALALLTACSVLLASGAADASTNAYVADAGGGEVSQFVVGMGGLLSGLMPATVMADTGPEGVAVSPDGKSVYVADAASGSVSQFDVGASALSAKLV